MKNFIIFLFFFLFSFLGSCAKPHWITEDDFEETHAISNCELISKKLNLCLQFKWIDMPSESDYGSFEIKSFKIPNEIQNGNSEIPVSINNLKVILWMPSMNHGSSPVTITPYNDSYFLIEDVFFIMPGAWDIQIYLKLDNGEQDKLIKKIHI